MSLDTSNLQLKAQIIDFLRSNLVVPQSFSEIYCAVMVHFDDQISSLKAQKDDAGAAALSQSIMQGLLELIEDRLLVTKPQHMTRFCINRDYLRGISERSKSTQEQGESSLNITADQFYEYLKFLAHFYEVTNGSYTFTDIDLAPNTTTAQKTGVNVNSKANIFYQGLVKRVTYNTKSTASLASLDGASSNTADSSPVLIEPFDDNFVKFNKGLSENSRFILGLPLLVHYDKSTKTRSYIPVFYYSMEKANFEQHSQASFERLVGPFINQAFLEVIEELLVSECQLVSETAKATSEFFLRSIDSFLSTNQGGLSEFSQLMDCVLSAYGELCADIDLVKGDLSRFKSLQSLSKLSNCIVLGSIICQSSCDRIKKQTNSDFKAMLDGGVAGLKQSALRYFFVDSAPSAHGAPVASSFNSFELDSKAALVVDIDPRIKCDEDQSKAVRSMLKNEVTLLQGPPGTGKTMTVATAAYNHLLRGQSVLVTSFNHAAVDAFVEKASANPEWQWAKDLRSEKYNTTVTLVQLAKEIVARKASTAEDFVESLQDFAQYLKNREQGISDREELLQLYDETLNQLQSALDVTVEQLLSIYQDDAGQLHCPKYVDFLLRKIFGAEDAQNRIYNVSVDMTAQKRQEWLQWINELLGFVSLAVSTKQEQAIPSGLKYYINLFKWHFFKDKEIYKTLGCERLEWLLKQVKAVAALKLRLAELSKNCNLHPGEMQEGELATECLQQIQLLSSVSVSKEVSSLLKTFGSKQHPLVNAQTQRELRNVITPPVKLNEHNEALLLKHTMHHYPVTATTVLSVGKTYPMQPGIFDLVIFDEAAQFRFIDAIPIIYRAKRIAVIGDPLQLSPVGSIGTDTIERLVAATNLPEVLQNRFNVNDTLFDFVRYGTTCFEGSALSLQGKVQEHLTYAVPYGLTSQDMFGVQSGSLLASQTKPKYIEPLLLRQNRRSVPPIVEYISNSFYDGRLVAGRQLPPNNMSELWVNSQSYAPGMHFIHVDSELSKEHNGSQGSNLYSQIEIDQTLSLLHDILSTGFKGSIGVIAPFRYHIDLTQKLVNQRSEFGLIKQACATGQVKIDTVHKFQGLDCDVIIYNLCLALTGNNTFALKPNLVNVALSRAKDFLFVVGNIYAVINNQDDDFVQNLRRYANSELVNSELQNYLAQGAQTNPAIKALISNTQLRFDTKWEQMLYKELLDMLDKDVVCSSEDYSLVTQLEYCSYRLDIALIFQNQGLDVECDGSQHYKYWHSPQDYVCVDSDLVRARELSQAMPLRFETMRFKNSLIESDPRQCAAQVVNKFRSIIKQARGMA